MKNDIAVSIIVPVYNAEKYLVKCLDSVINQKLKNIEIIIVDDGSTDGSSEICLEYAAKDSRIIYYRKENEGLAAARQDGIERATGEYVGFVDSDDWLELNMYEKMYTEAIKENADIVFCNCFFDDNKPDRVYLESGVYDRKRIEEEILPRSLAGINTKGSNSVIRWSNCLRMYKLSLIKDNNISFGRKFRRSQDLQLTFETTLYAQKYVSLNDEFLYHNRTQGNANSLSRGYTKNYWKLIRPLIDKLYEDVENYKKQDLSYNMHLCAFFFAENGIRNECNSKTNTLRDKLKNINTVRNDEIVKNALKYVDYKKFNKYYSMIYSSFFKKFALMVLLDYKLFLIKENKIRPLIRCFAQTKLGKLLLKIKHGESV